MFIMHNFIPNGDWMKLFNVGALHPGNHHGGDFATAVKQKWFRWIF